MSHMVILLFGKSGSGKSTIANALESKYGLRSLPSCTSRKPRHENDTEHIYLTGDEMGELRNALCFGKPSAGDDLAKYAAASVFYSGNYYLATMQQLLDYDVYITDIGSVYELLKSSVWYKKVLDIDFYPVFVKAGSITRFLRMLKRGDGVAGAMLRVRADSLDYDEEEAEKTALLTVRSSGIWKMNHGRAGHTAAKRIYTQAKANGVDL